MLIRENEVFTGYNVLLKGLSEFENKNVKICFLFFVLKVAFVQKTYTFVPDFVGKMRL